MLIEILTAFLFFLSAAIVLVGTLYLAAVCGIVYLAAEDFMLHGDSK